MINKVKSLYFASLFMMVMGISLTVKGQDQRTEPQLVKAELVKARQGLGNVLQKLQAGQPVSIAYFGGSITAAPVGESSLRIGLLAISQSQRSRRYRHRLGEQEAI